MSVTIIRNEASKGQIYDFDDLEDGDAYDCDGDIYIINKHLGAGVAGFGIDGRNILWCVNLHDCKLVPVNLQITVS